MARRSILEQELPFHSHVACSHVHLGSGRRHHRGRAGRACTWTRSAVCGGRGPLEVRCRHRVRPGRCGRACSAVSLQSWLSLRQRLSSQARVAGFHGCPRSGRRNHRSPAGRAREWSSSTVHGSSARGTCMRGNVVIIIRVIILCRAGHLNERRGQRAQAGTCKYGRPGSLFLERQGYGLPIYCRVVAGVGRDLARNHRMVRAPGL